MITLKKKFSDLDSFVINKKVILRIDLNLQPFDNEITDYTRLEKIIPTIEYLLNNNAKIILISHFGRPDGKIIKELSLKDLAVKIGSSVNKEVGFIEDNILKIKKDKIEKALENYQIILLENLRFYLDEERNDENFSKS